MADYSARFGKPPANQKKLHRPLGAGDDLGDAFAWATLLPGPKPLGNKVLTVAERQARFRASHANGAPRIRYRNPADRRSRAQRWHEAVAELNA
jgi:hypothetical protein